MRTNELRVNQIDDEAYGWCLAFIDAIEKKDIEAFSTFLADACELRLGDWEPIVGRDAIVEAVRQRWQGYETDEHDLRNIYGSDSAFAVEMRNAYRRIDGTDVEVRAALFIDRDHGVASAIRTYADAAKIVAPA